MTNKQKILTGCIIGTLAFTYPTTVAKAEEIPIAGINLVLENYYNSSGNTAVDIQKYMETEISNQYSNISFAQVTDYVNIRKSPSEEGDILGKLYNNSSATILEKKGDWYKVKSGNVKGYIKAEYLITGEKAEQIADKIATRVAVVTTTTLKVREKASMDSPVITLLPIDEELVVKKETEEWIKVELEGDETGFVSADYIKVKLVFEEAISIEEEQERIEEEQAALQEEQTSSGDIVDNTKVNSAKANTSSIRNQIVQYALQFEGNPYVWGGTSLTNGTDCSGFTQSVFRDNGISISRTSRTQAVGGKRISINEMQPGDLIFYDRGGTINHVGIYIGNGEVISASSPETGIRITNYNYRVPNRVVRYIND